MAILGLNFYINKYLARYDRASNMRKLGYAIHYTNNIEAIKQHYIEELKKSQKL
jgi:hypothetical protein